MLDDFDQAADLFATGDGYSYTRVANPTNDAVERRIADLEGGAEALLVGSGQAAVALSLLGLVQAGRPRGLGVEHLRGNAADSCSTT